QFDRDVLEDVTHPRALVLGESADEAARLAVRATVFRERRHRSHQALRELLPEPRRGPVLELAELHGEPDDGEVRVEAGAEVDGPGDDLHERSFDAPALARRVPKSNEPPSTRTCSRTSMRLTGSCRCA